jgi:tetraacyldisaccharide 4'-kinase
MNFLEKIYYSGFLLKKKYSLAARKRLPCRVISIGNLTVGGTGKTPAAIAVAEEALLRGYFPVVLTRGYRGKAKGPCFVTKGEGPLLPVEEAGDEPYLMASITRGVPVVKCSSRYDGGMFAINNLGKIVPDFMSRALFILDDGFQHMQLFRDRDIVLIDSEDPFGGDMLLPVGRLREPLRSVERADVIVITKGSILTGDSGSVLEKTIKTIRENNTTAPIFIACHRPVSCFTKQGEERSVSLISGKRVFGFCGIGNPDSFRKTLQAAAVDIAGFRNFRDHHSYTAPDIEEIRNNAIRSGSEWIVTTEKDIIKIRNLDLPENILIIRIKFSVDKAFYNSVFC